MIDYNIPMETIHNLYYVPIRTEDWSFLANSELSDAELGQIFRLAFDCIYEDDDATAYAGTEYFGSTVSDMAAGLANTIKRWAYDLIAQMNKDGFVNICPSKFTIMAQIGEEK